MRAKVILFLGLFLLAQSGWAAQVRLNLYSYPGDISVDPPGVDNQFPIDTVVQLTASSGAGWQFSHWENDASGTDNPLTLTLTQSMSVRAIFGSSIILAPGEHGTIRTQPEVAGRLVLFQDDVLVTPVPAPGYFLNSWGGAASGTDIPLQYRLLSPNPTIVASFLPLPEGKATLTALATEGGYASILTYRPGLGAKNIYDIGETLFVYAGPTTGYVFTGWSGDVTGKENPITVKLNTSKTVTANFTPGYSINVETNEGGVVVLDPAQEVYAPGTKVRITAMPAAGNTFGGWSEATFRDEPSVEVTMDRSYQLWARFKSASMAPLWSYGSSAAPVARPVLDDSGWLYTTDDRAVISLDSDGHERWRKEVGDGFSQFPGALAGQRLGGFQMSVNRIVPDGPDRLHFSLLRGDANGTLLSNVDDLLGNVSALSIGADSTAYAPTYGSFENGYTGSRLFSISPDGATNWNFYVPLSFAGNQVTTILKRPSIGVDGTLYFASIAPYAAGLYARSRNNAEIWSRPLCPALNSDAFAVYDYNYGFYPIDPTPVLGTNHIYLIDGDGSLLALNMDGSEAWRFVSPDVFQIPSLGADGTLYFGARNSSRFYALNPDGTVQWIRKPGLGGYRVAAISSAGTIFVADSFAAYALNAVGDRLWQYDANVGAPLIQANRVYFPGNAILAFDAGSFGQAASPWPMLNASYRNDGAALGGHTIDPHLKARWTFSAGTFFVAMGPSDQHVWWTVYASTDLTNWVSVFTHLDDGRGAAYAVNVSRTSFPYRFFRISHEP